MYLCECERCYIIFFFFFKQKTAYEMRISDWSSDVCSSDLWGLRTSSEAPSPSRPRQTTDQPKRGARCRREQGGDAGTAGAGLRECRTGLSLRRWSNLPGLYRTRRGDGHCPPARREPRLGCWIGRAHV